MSKFKDPIDQPFIFPEAIVKMLSEITNGNFILFYDNNGEPEIQAEFQTTLSEMGLRAYVTNFINSINKAEDIASTQNLLNSDNPPEGFDENSENEE